MDRELVIVVPSESAAYEVVKVLKGLDDEASIELYSSTVIAKRADGTLTVQDAHHLRGPWAAALGISTGALIGLLAGPVGVAIGAAVGGAAALGGELAYTGFVGDFVQEVSTRLQPGGFAVCASVWEDWTVPVDVGTAPFGVVFRQATDDVVVAQIRASWQQLKEEQAHLETEISRAVGDKKVKLEAKRDEIRAKQATQRERLHKRASALDETWHARIASIKAKAEHAKADTKARHEQHIEKLSRFAAEQKASLRELFA